MRRAGVADLLAGMLGLVACAVAGALDLLLRDVRWKEFPREGAWRHASGAALGYAEYARRGFFELAAVFVWFAATVLRGRRERFAFGALAAGWAGIVVLHALNPDAMIVRINAARSGSAERFDVGYATSLSADAVPALLAVLPTLAPAERCGAASRILERWTRTEGADWRVWNGGRARALGEVQRRRAELREVACPRRERGTGVVPTPAPASRSLRTGTPAPG